VSPQRLYRSQVKVVLFLDMAQVSLSLLFLSILVMSLIVYTMSKIVDRKLPILIQTLF
jgi:hypothetical protein